MSEKIDQKTLLETVLGSEIVIPASSVQEYKSDDILNVVSRDLFSNLSNYFNSMPPFFQTNLTLEKIVRYKNGSFSSMEKSIKGGFSQHQGFDLISSIDIVQQLMNHVMPTLNQRLISIYSDVIDQNSYYLSQIQDQFIIPELSELKSIAEFIKDVSEEIPSISKSNNLSVATLTNIQKTRIDLKKKFYNFIACLDRSVNSNFFNPNDIANNYLIARYSLSTYIVSLVLECVVSGNIDDESVQRLDSKVEVCFRELNSVTERLSNVLEKRKFTNSNEINNINSFYRWSCNYIDQIRINNLHYQNDDINYIKNNTLLYFDIELEKQRLKEFVNARHNYIKTIRVLEK